MVQTMVDDLTLVNRYVLGEERVLETLINRHKQKVFRHIQRLVKDHDLANDVFQETFIRVIHLLKSNQYAEEGKFLPWVLRIAHNMALDAIRIRKRRNSFENVSEESETFDELQDTSPSIETKMMVRQTYKHIKKLIYELPHQQRDVIILRHYNGLSFKEIAEETNVSINTALGRMRYGILNLRKLMDDHKIDLWS